MRCRWNADERDRKKQKLRALNAPPADAMSRGRPGRPHGNRWRTRHNRRMTKEELPDEVLSTMAIEWRRKALEGELHARGIAHELETELRRRAGAPFTNYDTLDMRPLETRSAPRRWWAFWRER